MGMHTSGEIDVKSTPAAVIATIVDFSSYPEWSSAHRKAVVEETGDDGRPSRVRMSGSAGRWWRALSSAVRRVPTC